MDLFSPTNFDDSYILLLFWLIFIYSSFNCEKEKDFEKLLTYSFLGVVNSGSSSTSSSY